MRLILLVTMLLVAAAAPAADAQPDASAVDRLFLCSVSAARPASRDARVYVDTGIGEPAFDLVQGDEPEQRIGVEAAFATR
jgi:hypothetical protein